MTVAESVRPTSLAHHLRRERRTEYAADLLDCPDVDGLGATRRGRDAATFVQIVRLIAQMRTP